MTERTFVSMSANGLLQEFKRHIRMTSDDLDAELYAKLMAAVRHAEHHIGKVILRSEFVTTTAFASTIALKVPNVLVLGLEDECGRERNRLRELRPEDHLADMVLGVLHRGQHLLVQLCVQVVAGHADVALELLEESVCGHRDKGPLGHGSVS